MVKLVRTSGKSTEQVSSELDLTETAVRAWVKRAEIDEERDPKGPLTSEERGEVMRLRREFRTVTMERDIRRKAKHASAGRGSGNSRNGESAKTLKTEGGDVAIEVSRDRNATFEPQLVKKHQTHFDGFDEKVISMYALDRRP